MLNIFGKGFIGSEFYKLYPDAIVNDRNDYEIKTDQVVYFISTIDNYNVLTDPYLDIETNLTTLIKVLESGKDRKDLVFNFISSWFVYGNSQLPAHEDDYCNPQGFYSITKRTAEQLLISYCKTFDINYRILRLGNVIGTTDSKASAKKNAIQYMISLVKNNQPVNLYENGDPVRDFIDVRDAARAIKLVVELGDLNEVYNIGNGEPVRIGDVVKYAVDKTGSTSQLNSVEPSEFHKIVQTRDHYLNIKKLKDIGYTRSIPLYQTIDELIVNVQ